VATSRLTAAPVRFGEGSANRIPAPRGVVEIVAELQYKLGPRFCCALQFVSWLALALLLKTNSKCYSESDVMMRVCKGSPTALSLLFVFCVVFSIRDLPRFFVEFRVLPR
jgi:hypothetical protein